MHAIRPPVVEEDDGLRGARSRDRWDEPAVELESVHAAGKSDGLVHEPIPVGCAVHRYPIRAGLQHVGGVVGGDNAEQSVALVHHGNRQQTAISKHARRDFLVGVGAHADDATAGELADAPVGLGEHESRRLSTPSKRSSAPVTYT